MNPIDPLTPLERLVFGDDAKRGPDGRPIEQGVGSPHAEEQARALAARKVVFDAWNNTLEPPTQLPAPPPPVPRFIDVRTRTPTRARLPGTSTFTHFPRGCSRGEAHGQDNIRRRSQSWRGDWFPFRCGKTGSKAVEGLPANDGQRTIRTPVNRA
jgi:hypothetical protein